MNREIGLGEIRDGIVSESTQKSYLPELFYLLMWLRVYESDVLTTYAHNMFNEFEKKAGEEKKMSKILAKNRNEFVVAIRHADVNPLIYEEVYMDYARQLRKKRQPNKTLGKQAYGVKRAALFHLFRAHNGDGYSHAYCLKLTNYFKGLNRVLVNRRRDRAVAVANSFPDGEEDLQNRPPVIENVVDQRLNINSFSKSDSIDSYR
jgi:hypothetical protein